MRVRELMLRLVKVTGAIIMCLPACKDSWREQFCLCSPRLVSADAQCMTRQEITSVPAWFLCQILSLDPVLPNGKATSSKFESEEQLIRAY